ncbi:alkaline phosphatase family protein [Ktedonosporobacter rubrisoli]|uniref:Alkaline phosphatase family protein n=1 Tax=Ktedonosporobacter rubrisoli TaxID=2509675 RepID=A0A4P6JTJ9_KTERU|nr:alkaline phosphatase family protein [Ktedonosporobacter rubrisoli]QBD78898.1 alkaline phosphatase family protein [Ktedonosporobacter rubrisoli]
MINSASLHAVNEARFSQRFIRPRYDSYCFANLPPTIEFLFTGKQQQQMLPLDAFGDLPRNYTNVIFFFIDSFGWRFFERVSERFHFLKAIQTEGAISKMTSQFPSTTAAHVTCIHTGLDVGQSGIYEWNYYEPLVDDIITPLLFSYARDKVVRDTVKRAAIPAERFFPKQTFYQTLQQQGIASHILQYQAYTPSTYSDIVFRGASVHPYKTIQEAFDLLVALVTARPTQPTYYFLYFDRIDTASHNHGPYSRQATEVADSLFTLMDHLFYKNIRGKAGNTLFMLTADHGQVEVDPQTTFYLNRQMPGFTRYLKTNQKGAPLVPAGSPRDMFLHIKEECLDEAVGELRRRLAGRAEVYPTQELLEQHFFGLHEPSPALRSRLGNVVILPYRYETVWWYEEGRFEMHFQGHHGGLTAEEMEIPLLLLPL